jgi:hypothetical protein
MSERLDLILVALNELHSVSITLTEYARELSADPAARLTDFEDVPELLASALATSLDALPEDRMTHDRNQLLGASRRFLDGWVG